MSDNTAVYAGSMPRRQGELALVVSLVVYAGMRWLKTGTPRDALRAEPVASGAGSL